MADEPSVYRNFSAIYQYMDGKRLRCGNKKIESSSITGAVQKILTVVPDRYKIVSINIHEIFSKPDGH